MKKEREQPHITDPRMEREPYSLSGAELHVYADLWAYSRENPFVGSYNRLADWIGIPKTTLMRCIKYLESRELVEVVSINAHKTTFQAKAIPHFPLPIYRWKVIGYTDMTTTLSVQSEPKLDQNGPSQYNIYNNNTNNNYKKRNFNKSYSDTYSGPTSEAPYRMTDEQKRELEEQQRAEDRRRREEHDKAASTPEALAARDRFFAKFCPEEKSMCS